MQGALGEWQSRTGYRASGRTRPGDSSLRPFSYERLQSRQVALTAQNELQKSRFIAEGDSIQATGRAKAILAEAQAQAKANLLLSQSITATLVQYEMAKKWNGQMPQVSGSAIPMLQLPRP